MLSFTVSPLHQQNQGWNRAGVSCSPEGRGQSFCTEVDRDTHSPGGEEQLSSPGLSGFQKVLPPKDGGNQQAERPRSWSEHVTHFHS